MKAIRMQEIQKTAGGARSEMKYSREEKTIGSFLVRMTMGRVKTLRRGTC